MRGERGRPAGLYTRRRRCPGSNGHNPSGGIGRLSSLDSGPLAGQATLLCRARAGPWAELAAQARARGRAVPGTGTQAAGPGRAWAVLSQEVPVPAHRARPIWKTLDTYDLW